MLTEPNHNSEFLLSEGDGAISREGVVIALGQKLIAGTVLGKVATSGEYVAYDDAATDGSETAVAVLIHSVDATLQATPAAAIARLAEVVGVSLTGLNAAATADLHTQNIIVR